ncbi:hypothetical protein [Lacipirellula parvula]|uniref:Uncharacterized protein n=1 Tax=Lacipirellula parvula TaxID=2650471 RepID=A0A5K7X941_9BACT|nr:hypothetical protein [Lacipirellula parvula]BBO33190.1 hypothetical protein PLANPX_2802 [Lacipirellula parvula]
MSDSRESPSPAPHSLDKIADLALSIRKSSALYQAAGSGTCLDSIETDALTLEDALTGYGAFPSLGIFSSTLNEERQRVVERLRNVRTTVQFVRAGQAGASELTEAVDGFTPAAASWVRNARHYSATHWGKSLKTLKWVVGGIAAIVLTILYWQSGLTTSNRSVMFPLGPFEEATEPGVVSAIPRERENYLKSFSEHFFRRDPSFRKDYFRYWETAAEFAPPRVITEKTKRAGRGVSSEECVQRWRGELLNCSYLNSFFLSEVAVEVRKAEPGEFPWNELRVRPRLVHSLEYVEASIPEWAQVIADGKLPEYDEQQVLKLENHGLGPAVDVQCTLSTEGGMWLLTREAQVIHEVQRDVDFAGCYIGGSHEVATVRLALEKQTFTPIYDEVDEPGKVAKRSDPSEHFRPSIIDGSAQLLQPIFYRREGVKVEPSADIFEHNGVQYEIVRTLNRLKELTPTAWNEGALFLIEYKSLAGQLRSTKIFFDLPASLAYYRPSPALLWYDPRVGPPQMPMQYQEEAGVPETLVIKPPHVEPVGENVIRLEFAFDSLRLAKVERLRSVADVGMFLKPRGRLLVDADVLRPGTGRYEVKVLVNGQLEDRYYVDTLAPEELTFHENDLDQVNRLQENWKE